MPQAVNVRIRRFRIGVVALVVVTAAALAAGPAQAAQAAPPSFFGIVPNDDLQAVDYQLMGQANVGSARVTLFWRAIEESPDEFDWERTDRQIGSFASQGIAVLPNLYGIPNWLSNENTKPPLDTDRERAEWEQFVREAVSRYGQGGTYWRTEYPLQFPGAQPAAIANWQFWNEENGPKHFWPRPDVNKYAMLLEIARRAVSSVNPEGRIVTGGLVSKPTGAGGIKASKFLKKLMKTESGPQSFDGVGLHPYAANDGEIVKQVKKLRRVLKKGGKKKAQVWITEVGWGSNPNGPSPKLSTSPTRQKKLLKKTYKRLEKKSRRWKIGGVYWYTWRDAPGGICDWCPDAGLLTRDLQPKPAFSAYQKVAG